MLKHRKFKTWSFWTGLLLIMLHGNAFLYGQQLPENIVDTALTWLNQVRVQDGLERLSVDPQLNRAAQAHSEKMSEHNVLSDSNPELGTPFERLQSSGVTDISSLVAVAQAKTWDQLQKQLKLQNNYSKIVSPEMTHVGIGIEQDSTGDLWLTIHMIERAITFTQFTLDQSNTTPVSRSITIKGNTPFKQVEAVLVPPEDSNQDLAVDRIIAPDSNGDFEVTLSFGTATGIFEFEFYVQKDGVYKLKNSFSMGI